MHWIDSTNKKSFFWHSNTDKDGGNGDSTIQTIAWKKFASQNVKGALR